ncbi:uncharacterized protein BT62DRAFT_1006108 [Guyanagaster necrorhizus]|uniref:Uncharacterized protein n=1 Tax=Guyanagaster necrorhizus TaxID=856835 RepID=A0A9P8ASA5_9AGAR|nr:uncharacterized protein BT62DRAFT_1006108 [Guyanagaster necrorhizus MCA 3950]KAG7445925.1 hypothetical protein BT62DRAFT_1006108 [Guyanagaster necrorhizus MCA 3950]
MSCLYPLGISSAARHLSPSESLPRMADSNEAPTGRAFRENFVLVNQSTLRFLRLSHERSVRVVCGTAGSVMSTFENEFVYRYTDI